MPREFNVHIEHILRFKSQVSFRICMKQNDQINMKIREMYQGSAEAQDCPSQEESSGEFKRRRERRRRWIRRSNDVRIHSFGY